jgi:hypothetical protein
MDFCLFDRIIILRTFSIKSQHNGAIFDIGEPGQACGFAACHTPARRADRAEIAPDIGDVLINTFIPEYYVL